MCTLSNHRKLLKYATGNTVEEKTSIHKISQLVYLGGGEVAETGYPVGWHISCCIIQNVNLRQNARTCTDGTASLHKENNKVNNTTP